MSEKIKYNYEVQEYSGIKLKLIQRDYRNTKAKRYVIIPPEKSIYNQENQNVWIPDKHTEPDGTLKKEDMNYVFRKAQNQLNYAGYRGPIIGIKRAFKEHVEPPKGGWLSDETLNDLFPPNQFE